PEPTVRARVPPGEPCQNVWAAVTTATRPALAASAPGPGTWPSARRRRSFPAPPPRPRPAGRARRTPRTPPRPAARRRCAEAADALDALGGVRLRRARPARPVIDGRRVEREAALPGARLVGPAQALEQADGRGVHQAFGGEPWSRATPGLSRDGGTSATVTS